MLDRYTEIVAHFIGQFDQAAEQSLYRLYYEGFRAQQRPGEDPGALLEINVHVSSELPPDTYFADRVRWNDREDGAHHDGPGLDLVVRDIGPVAPVPPMLFGASYGGAGFGGSGSSSATGTTPTEPQTPSLPQTPVVDIPAPGGIIVFAYQQNTLQDNDTLLSRPLELSPELAASRSDAALDEGLMTLASAADALLPGDLTLGRESTDTATRIETLRESYAGAGPTETPADGATVTQVSQSDGTLPESGILVDGAGAESVPTTLEEALEARGYGKEEDAGEEGASEEAEGDGVLSATVVIGPDDTGPYADAMQIIQAGGNLLMNSVDSGLTAVDAPIIAVAGQALSYTVISQVNVMSDRDFLVKPDAAPCADGDLLEENTASEGHNVASVTWQGESRGETEHTGGPLGFAITEIEGDLVLTTHAIQINLITDNDVISFETTFHTVEIGSGGNVSTNVLDEIGFQSGFDMILVGGDMLGLVSVSQVNVLFDNDLVVDNDDIGADINTAGNLLWNEAEVTWHGIDTAAPEVSESAANALETMAGGQLDVGTLTSEGLLDGTQVPLLLTIGGDLVLDYRLEQINILADADTVQVFADVAAQNGYTPVDVETGDNLLANVASLDIYGTDSTIMATDGVFSDLVIHQAGMYDTDDAPLDTPPFGSDLASEAVVFLADGMIDDGHGADIGGGEVIADTGGGSGAFDTLGGVVA